MKRHIIFIAAGAISIALAMNYLKNDELAKVFFWNRSIDFWSCLTMTCSYAKSSGERFFVFFPTLFFWGGVALSVVGLVGAGVALGLMTQKQENGDDAAKENQS